MYYYQRLKDIREDEDLKQTDIADLLNITRQQYQLYESGKREIPFHSVIEIANKLKISIDYIAGRTNDKKGLSKSTLTDQETELIKKFRCLNDTRKGNIMGRVEVFFEQQQEEHNIRQDIG